MNILSEEVKEYYLGNNRTYFERIGNRIKLFKENGDVISYNLDYYTFNGTTIVNKTTGEMLEVQL